MNKITLFYSIQNNCDGSAELKWFLTRDAAKTHQDNMEGWSERCMGSAETFEGSDIHKEAISNDEEVDDEDSYDEEEEPEVWSNIRLRTATGSLPEVRVFLEGTESQFSLPSGELRVEMDLKEDDLGGCYIVRVLWLELPILSQSFGTEAATVERFNLIVGALTDADITD